MDVQAARASSSTDKKPCAELPLPVCVQQTGTLSFRAGKSCSCCHYHGARLSSFTMEQAKPRIALREICGFRFLFKLEWMEGTVCSGPRTEFALAIPAPSNDKPQQFLPVACFVHHGDVLVQSHSSTRSWLQCYPESLQGLSAEDVFPTELTFFILWEIHAKVFQSML